MKQENIIKPEMVNENDIDEIPVYPTYRYLSY